MSPLVRFLPVPLVDTDSLHAARSFFFPSILAGPSFTYRSYDSFTSHRLFVKENPSDGSKPVDPTVIPPGRRRKAAKRFATGIFFLAIFSVYGGSLGMDKLIDPKFTADKSWFEKCVRSRALSLPRIA